MSTLPQFDIMTQPRVLQMRPQMTEDEFWTFCRQNDELRIEKTKEGFISIMSPTGGLTGSGNAEITMQLGIWWKQHKRGMVFDSSAGFYLPDGSMLSPDGAYLSEERLKALSHDDLRRFPHVCPDFVIELTSETDPLKAVQAKMVNSWMANGALLGWLVDPKDKQALIYRLGKAPECFTGKLLIGEGPVDGFVLDLSEVWARYEK